jgi:hypothetical protein
MESCAAEKVFVLSKYGASIGARGKRQGRKVQRACTAAALNRAQYFGISEKFLSLLFEKY